MTTGNPELDDREDAPKNTRHEDIDERTGESDSRCCGGGDSCAEDQDANGVGYGLHRKLVFRRKGQKADLSLNPTEHSAALTG